jgi:XTP/dITP diphosphohydrolase
VGCLADSGPRGDALLVATTNPNKIREIVPLLAPLNRRMLTLADLPAIPEPDEAGTTFWENARLKALAYAAASGMTVVAEDSGLEIAALDGAPGVQSARFLGAGVAYPTRFRDIFARLNAVPERGRAARFVTALAVARGGEILFETETTMDGEIADAPRGEHGFGYDPIFLYPPLGKTTAELTRDAKAAVSHRARAFRDFVRWTRAHAIPN